MALVPIRLGSTNKTIDWAPCSPDMTPDISIRGLQNNWFFEAVYCVSPPCTVKAE